MAAVTVFMLNVAMQQNHIPTHRTICLSKKGKKHKRRNDSGGWKE